MESRMEYYPHPYFAKYAMRMNGCSDEDLISCNNHAKENCPNDLPYAIRLVDGCYEWYAPAFPKIIHER